MTYLVDANVLSEATKPSPRTKVIEWLSAHERDFVVDPVILGEICLGILLLPQGRKRAQLQQWFEAVLRTIDCLPWDAAVSRRWAELVLDLKRNRRTIPILDSMIAATALHHHLTIATRNTRDFQNAGAKVFDPFA